MSAALRLAFLGDIHGNLPALEVVLDDIEREKPDGVFLLGDLINRHPWTREVLDLLRHRNLFSVQGNHDLVVAQLHTRDSWPQFNERRRFPNLHWTWERLRAQDIRYLRNLPHELLIEIEGAPRLRLFHGLPGNPFAGIVPGAEAEAVAQEIAIYDEAALICGHTHQPLDRTIRVQDAAAANRPGTPRKQRILNPGSVGMSYNGDPRAHYLLLDLIEGDGKATWEPQFRRLDYDRERVARAFKTSGLLAASGAIAKLNLKTLADGLPWNSDFARWMQSQPQPLRNDPDVAVDLYLETHGPNQWAFDG